MMKEKKKTKCFNRIKCVKPKMDLVRNNGNQVNMKVLVGSSQKTMMNLAMKKVLMMMKIAMTKISNRKKMKMTNRAIITFDSTKSDIYLTYSHFCLVILKILRNNLNLFIIRI